MKRSIYLPLILLSSCSDQFDSPSDSELENFDKDRIPIIDPIIAPTPIPKPTSIPKEAGSKHHVNNTLFGRIFSEQNRIDAPFQWDAISPELLTSPYAPSREPTPKSR